MKLFLLLMAFATLASNCFAQSDEPEKQKVLILYYSQTGVTEKVAKELQLKLGADVEKLEITEPYNGNFDETIQRCLKEMKNNELPHLRPIQSDLKKYDVIFLGFPVWFGTYARPVITMVKSLKFAGKKIVPFCTFGSGGLVECSAQLKEALPLAEIKEGFGIREARIDRTAVEIDRFLKLNGYIEGNVERYPEYSEQKPVKEEEKQIFDAACSNYKFPLGTPVTVGLRQTPEGTDYLFTATGKTPDGKDTESKIYITVETGKTPEFTLVVR